MVHMPTWCRDFELGKYSWPELVGYNGEHAATVIENENSKVTAIILEDGAIQISPHMHCDRVIVWVDEHGIVVRTPTIA